MAARGDKMTLTIRTSKELHKWLVAEAKKNNRSLNQQVEWMLMQWREGERAKPLLDELRALLAESKKK